MIAVATAPSSLAVEQLRPVPERDRDGDTSPPPGGLSPDRPTSAAKCSTMRLPGRRVDVAGDGAAADDVDRVPEHDRARVVPRVGEAPERVPQRAAPGANRYTSPSTALFGWGLAAEDVDRVAEHRRAGRTARRDAGPRLQRFFAAS